MSEVASTSADVSALLAPMRARSEGLTALCPEHLRQGIRHLQRNCSIECNVHEDEDLADVPDACKQPGRNDGDRMAASLADLTGLFAAIDAVTALHAPFTWDFGQGPVTSCKGCVDSGVPEIHAEYPCPTARVLLEALTPKA